jgi:hypothetical protein
MMSVLGADRNLRARVNFFEFFLRRGEKSDKSQKYFSKGGPHFFFRFFECYSRRG